MNYQVSALWTKSGSALSGYKRILHDYERPPYYLPRSISPGYLLDDYMGFPEMCPTFEYQFMKMTEPWQKFMFEVLSLYSPASMTFKQLKSSWRSFYDTGKALTNKHGFSKDRTKDHRDYINGTGMDLGLPGLQSITMGGNVVKLIGEPVSKAGEMWQQVEALDGRRNPPSIADVNREKTPWLIHVAVTSTPFGFDGKWTDKGPWRCNPFPNNNGAHCCFPFVAMTPQFIQVDRLGPVYQMPPHPYNP